jgi:hypothetical protein
MAYISQERKAKIAPKVKAICAKYGVKATLAIRTHSSLVLNIKSGTIDFIGNSNEVCGGDNWQVSRGFRANTSGYDRINPYHFKSHYSGKALKFLTEVYEAMQSAGWYDNSDAQVDHFDIAYYIEINIGRWNKPYTLTV